MKCSSVVIALFLVCLPLYSDGKRPPKSSHERKAVKKEESANERFDDSALSLTIEHAIGIDGEFTVRGSVFLRSLKSSQSAVNFQQDTLTSSDLHSIKSAARTGQLYFIRASSKLTDTLSDTSEENITDSHYVTTAISACSLVTSKLSDVIRINGDGQGNVIGLTITTLLPTTGKSCDRTDISLPHHFNTSLIVDNGTPGTVPDVQGFLRKAEKEEKDKREGKDNRSFLQKYWMYIVIGFLVFTMLGGAGGGGG